MPFEDFMHAIGALKQSVQEVQTTRAIEGANQQVAQIRSMEGAEHEKNNQLRQVANNLTMHLSGLGANPQQIETVGKAVQPYDPLYQTVDQQLLNGTPEEQKRAQQIKDRQYAQEMALLDKKTEASLASAGIRSNSKQNDKILSQIEKFAKTPQLGGKILDSLGELGSFRNMVNEGSYPAMAMARKALVIMSGDKRPSDLDVKAVAGNPSFSATVQRNFLRIYNGEAPEGDKKDLLELADAFEYAKTRQLETNIDKYSKGTAGLLGETPEQFGGRLKTTYLPNYKGPQTAAVNPQVDAAKAWLSANPNHPDAAAVKAKLGL